MEELISVHRNGRVGTIVFCRGAALNALNLSMSNQLRVALNGVAEDDEVRAVVLRGEGRSFMAGGDLKEVSSGTGSPWSTMGPLIDSFHACVAAIRRMGKPVIASVHGAVAGGGLSLALAADIVVASRSSRFVLAYDKLGTSPDGGCTYSLVHALGQKRAAEVLLLGEDFGVEQAAEWGLVSRIVSDEELDLVAQDLATRLATKSRHAMAATKALIAQAPVSSFESQLLSEMSHFLRCAETSDFRKRVQAFLGK